MFNEGNQIHNFMSSSGSLTVIISGSGSDFLTSSGSGSGSTGQKVTVPMIPVPVPQHWFSAALTVFFLNSKTEEEKFCYPISKDGFETWTGCEWY